MRVVEVTRNVLHFTLCHRQDTDGLQPYKPAPFVCVDICNNHYLETIYIVNVNIANMHVSLSEEKPWLKPKILSCIYIFIFQKISF